MAYREDPPKDPKQEERERQRALLKAKIEELDFNEEQQKRLEAAKDQQRELQLSQLQDTSRIITALWGLPRFAAMAIVKVWSIAFIFSAFVVMMISVMLWAGGERHKKPDINLLFILLIFSVVSLGIYLVGVRLLVRREKRRLANLPFPVEGYWKAIADKPPNYAQLSLVVHFTGGVPQDREILEGSLKLSPDKKALVNISLEVVTFRSGGLLTYHKGNHDTGPVRDSFHEFLKHVLLPLHGAYPIEKVVLTAR